MQEIPGRRAARTCAGSPSDATLQEESHRGGHDHCCHDQDHYGHHDHAHGHDHAATDKGELIRCLLALGLALIAELLDVFVVARQGATWAGMGLAVVAIGLSGMAVFRQGWRALLRFHFSIDTLMAVAVTGAFLIGEWPEAAMVMALYALAELLEHRAVDRARHAIRDLLDISPQTARRQTVAETWEMVPVALLQPGQVVQVRPGERFPVDGHVLQGQGAVDESPITGESLPREKKPGDEVFAGSLNMTHEIMLEVSAAANDTVVARIIHAVEEAQQRRAPTQRFIDRFAAIYTPLVFLLAVGVASGGPLLLDMAWADAVYRALVLLVIACPCALVISTPVTIVSALTAAARRGILIKGGIHLERARSLRTIAFDKTGTITEGRPALVDAVFLPADFSEAQLLGYARALASRSDHPVAQAIADGLPMTVQLPSLDHFEVRAGHGVRGIMEGVEFTLGNEASLDEAVILTADVRERMQAQEAQGRSVSLMAGPHGVLALFAVADTVRPVSAAAVLALQRQGVRPLMLTGDNETTARAIAQQAGIAQIYAGLLPDDKRALIHSLRETEGLVAMVGDGINDAPALAVADIGFAMGEGGTDIAMDTADVVILNDDLRRVAETIALSRQTHTVLWQNISLALVIKVVFMVLALSGLATMWMAVFADVGASLLVVANGLRLLRARISI